MLGYQTIFEKSLNGIKTVSDGISTMSNGIMNVNEINASGGNLTGVDIAGGDIHCTSLNLNNVVYTDEFETLDGIDTTQTIQNQFDDIHVVIDDISNTYLSIVNAESSYGRLAHDNHWTATNYNNRHIILTTDISETITPEGLVTRIVFKNATQTQDRVIINMNGMNCYDDFGTLINKINVAGSMSSRQFNILDNSGNSIFVYNSTTLNPYLTIANAISTYLTITTASATYLTISNAISTYLTISNASATYLSITNALSTYVGLSSNNTLTGNNRYYLPESMHIISTVTSASSAYDRMMKTGLLIHSAFDYNDTLFIGAGNIDNGGGMIQYCWDTSIEALMLYRSIAISPYGGTTFIGMVNDGSLTHTCKIGGTLLVTTSVDVSSINVTNITSSTGSLLLGNATTHIVGPNSSGVNFCITNYAGNNMYLNNDKVSNYGDVHINSNSNNSDTFIDKGDVTIVEGSISMPYGSIDCSAGTISTAIDVSDNSSKISTTKFVKDSLTDFKTLNNSFTGDQVFQHPRTIVPQFPCGYYMDGGSVSTATPTVSSSHSLYPIMCSTKRLPAEGVDDAWIVAPGYKFVLYKSQNYGGFHATISNYDATFNIPSIPATTKSVVSEDLFLDGFPTTSLGQNSVKSVKVYYQSDSNEITSAILS